MFRLTCAALLACVAASGQELLYNGIRLPEVWPPRDVVLTNAPIPEPPYLVNPPTVIPIDVGRQLFVDDFLIEKTDLRRVYHRAEMYPGNPVFETMAYSGGLFYDPRDQLFKGSSWNRVGKNGLFRSLGDAPQQWFQRTERSPRVA